MKHLTMLLLLAFSTSCIDDEPTTSTTESELTVCDTAPPIITCPSEEPPGCMPRRCDKDTHCWICVH